MKNSLQLEVQLKIKRANRFLAAKNYPQTIREYTQGLELYQENRTYNESVSEQFQSLLYSLRANTYSMNLDAEAAEEDFFQSLRINPYNPTTLSRRARHFMKQKRFSEAVQDIDLALLYDPQNLSYISLLNSIQNYANEMNDERQKKHISKLVSQVKARLHAKPPTQSQSDEQDGEQILNFSKLKKIDRKSVKLASQIQKHISTIQFKQDQVLEYDNEQEVKGQTKYEQQAFNIRVSSPKQIEEKIKDQDEQLKQLQTQEQQLSKSQIRIPEQIVLTKSHLRSRKSILRMSSVGNDKGDIIFISTPGEKTSNIRRSSISAASIKDIDGKLIVHQSQTIRFRPSMSHLSKSDLWIVDQIPGQNDKQNFLTRTTPKLQKRKSCLRNSIRSGVDEFQQLSKTAPLQRKSSNFLNIKNIDGEFHKKIQSSQQQTPIKIQTESDDDDDYHDIFGSKKQKQLIDICDNMEDIPKAMALKLGKKKSILRKDSFLNVSTLSWKNQKKKSVLFKTG